MTSDQKVANAKEGHVDLTKSKDTIEMEESMATEDSDAVVVDPNSVSFLRKGFNQNIVAGIVAFSGPGLFNAMQGLGNAGPNMYIRILICILGQSVYLNRHIFF
jgi:hypothetical protein